MESNTHKHDDVIDTIEELNRESSLEEFHDFLSRLFWDPASIHFCQYIRTDVGGHDDNTVPAKQRVNGNTVITTETLPEIYNASVAIGETPFV